MLHQSVIFCGQFIHAILFCSLLLRLLSFDFSLRIFLAQAGQYLDAPEPGTYSTPHTVQFLAGIAAHRFVGMSGRGKYGSGYPLPMLATNVFIPYALLRSYARFCQTSAKEKRCNPQKKITTLSKPYSILTDTSYLPSVSTSAISFAVALTIRMPVSLIPSRSASSCRRCVFFSGGVSKRNWSTDIL